MDGRLRYVALGDSYTIGTSVAASDRWPDRLVAALGGDAGPLELIANMAVNGYSAGDVRRLELPAVALLRPGFISLLVGVNDVVRGIPVEVYRADLETVVDELLGLVPPDRLLLVTTPDYTVTPAGADYGEPAVKRAGIERVNEILVEIGDRRGVPVVDIYDLSLRATADLSLVASDGLHPSGIQYGLWVERIGPVVRRMLAA
jgi:lysophospholipase L1-like esterase